ncbi:hypothetical protein B0T17DRAFT_650863 [Bombardia bombarda]|uniref:Methyltransferase domain-containing protein n=1 Tax=Bombardia bombarda TaxID=252184 RepID=A0AA40CG05_9PEZI|nr:hypothetical protein B0T17DRAFT_650863 [Bombardia bombarda]
MAEVKDVVDGEYPLTRDYVDFNRLNLQHYQLKDLFGYNIHPKIPHHQKSLKIADVGTGTGIWLLDVASQLDPSAELYGLDCDISQVAPKEWLPENLTLREWSVFDDVPEDLAGKFDIMNIRLFILVISDDPRPVIQRLLKLLKPGGYLQWGEIDPLNTSIVTASPDLPTDYHKALFRENHPKNSRMVAPWIRDLPQIFEEQGLLDVEADWRNGKPHAVLAMHWCCLHIHEMVIGRVRRSNPEKAAELDAIFQGTLAEARKGVAFSIDRVVVVGQKPLQ